MYICISTQVIIYYMYMCVYYIYIYIYIYIHIHITYNLVIHIITIVITKPAPRCFSTSAALATRIALPQPCDVI